VAPEISALIVRLTDPAWKERQKAQDALVAMGNGAVTALQSSLNDNPDSELRHRIQTVLVKIEQIGETGASSITLDLNDVSPQQFFSELSKQIRAELLPAQENLWDNNTFAKQSIKVQSASFWEVMKLAQEKFGIEVVQWGDGIRIVPNGQGGGTMRGPSAVSGPFMVVAQRVHRAQTIDLANGGGTQNEFHVQFMGFAEPKLRLLQAGSELQLDEATDDNGNSLILTNAPAHNGYASGINGAWNFTARIRYPEQNPGRKIARLKGRLPVILQTGYESIDIEDPLSQKNVVKNLGGMKFVMKELLRNNDRFTLKLAIHVNPEMHARLQGILNNNGNNADLRLIDDTGQTYFAQSRGTNNVNNVFDVTIDFVSDPYRRSNRKTPGQPVKLTIRVPTETKNVSIPVEFNDLPIP